MIFVPPKDLSFEEVETAILNLVLNLYKNNYQLRPTMPDLQLGHNEWRALNKGPNSIGKIEVKQDNKGEDFIEVICSYGKIKCYYRPGRS